MSNSSSLGAAATIDVADVKAALIEILEIGERADTLDASTPLTSIPELDSLAVAEIVVDFERRFSITFDDDDITADVFETLASLAAFVEAKAR